MLDFKFIVDPLIGTLIGFGTNYIAVKMLFRPYKPIKIGKFTLPFTPGVIPKRKKELAKSLGNTISNELLTNNDIKDIFLSEEVKKKISKNIVLNLKKQNISLKEFLLNNIDDEKYNKLKIKIQNLLCERISESLLRIDVGNIIVEEGSKVVKEKLSENIFGKFISEEKIKNMAEPIKEQIDNYLQNNIKNLIFSQIDIEIKNIEQQNVNGILEKLDLTDEKLEYYIEYIYVKIVEEKMQSIFSSLNISESIEKKIYNMDVKEIEKLFMIVMKKELNAIVNLGAILGLILGIINAFIL